MNSVLLELIPKPIYLQVPSMLYSSIQCSLVLPAGNMLLYQDPLQKQHLNSFRAKVDGQFLYMVI